MCLNFIRQTSSRNWLSIVGGRCEWNGSGQMLSGFGALVHHVRDVHNMLTLETSPKVFFCHECAGWIYRQLDWEEHCAEHCAHLTPFCGRLYWRSCVVIGMKCPFCLGSGKLIPPQRYRQFEDVRSLHKHLQTHLKDSMTGRCPHPCCNDFKVNSPEELINHFIAFHTLPSCLKNSKD